jgi:phospholipase/carboxylesterase
VVDGWSADLDRPGLPIWITHGRRDPVIGVEFARAARDALSASPVDLTYVEHDGAHHVDPRALAKLPAWVDSAIDRAGAPAR